MRFILACVFVLLAIQSAVCMTSSEEFLTTLKLKVARDYASERQQIRELSSKIETVCPGYGSKTPAMLQEVMECWEEIDMEHETMCSSVRNHFEQCFKPMTDFFEECLPEKSKDIPDFFIRSIVDAAKYLCKADGEHIFELYNTCARTPNARTQRCLRRLETKVQQYGSKYPNKSEICELTRSMRGCLQSHLTSSCGHQTTIEAFLGLYDAFFLGCNNDNSAMNEIEDLSWKSDKNVEYM